MQITSTSDRIRNASVTISKGTVYPVPDVEIEGYRIVMYHEAWTGVRWMPITNRDEAFSLEEARSIARNMRDSIPQ